MVAVEPRIAIIADGTLGRGRLRQRKRNRGIVCTREYYVSLRGSLDEFRVIHAALADDFVKLSFGNLKPGSRLILGP